MQWFEIDVTLRVQASTEWEAQTKAMEAAGAIPDLDVMSAQRSWRKGPVKVRECCGQVYGKSVSHIGTHDPACPKWNH